MLFLVLACAGHEPVGRSERAITIPDLVRLEVPLDLAGGGAAAAVVADYDLDGLVDVAILPANGDGAVALQAPDGTGLAPTGAPLSAVRRAANGAATDLDLDGDTDLLATCDPCADGDRTTVYLNRLAQQGTVEFEGRAGDLGLPDLNHSGVALLLDHGGDGDVDILLVSTTRDAGGTRLLDNRIVPDGALAFEDASADLPQDLLSDAVGAVALDVNEDGLTDFYLARAGADRLIVQREDGIFVDESEVRGARARGAEVGLASGDLEGDGDVDILLAERQGDVVALLADGDGTFTQVALSIAGPQVTAGVAAVDLGGDGRPEIVLSSGSEGHPMTALAWAGVAGGVPTYDSLEGFSLPNLAGAPHAFRTGLGGSAGVGIPGRADRRSEVYVVSARDSDCDGIDDQVEAAFGLNPLDPEDAEADPDGDGVPSADELRTGGDPGDPDSDGDGQSDFTDLLVGRDLDGDGAPFETDVCPEDVDPDQLDSDGDGVGDLCDHDATDPDPEADDGETSARVIFEARSVATGDRALLMNVGANSSRLLGDQKGLMPTGATFRVLRQLEPGTSALVELFRSETGDHAYVTDETDRDALVVLGYEVLGRLGFVGEEPLAFGDAVLVRRFVRVAGGREEAITADADTAAALLAAGYAELDSLGWAIADGGRTRGPRGVVRYRRTADGAPMHSSLLSGEAQDLSGFETEGTRFRVLVERNGWTLPLYRLRSDGGDEVLSSSAEDVAAFEALGYVNHGLLGHVYRTSPVDTVHGLSLLFRLVGPDGKHAQSADAEEIATLVSSGFISEAVLGRVVRQPEPRGPECQGRGPTRSEILEARLSSIDDLHGELVQNVSALLAMAHSCTGERVLTGRIATPLEEATASALAPIDPEVRARLLEGYRAWHDVDPAVRADALGDLGYLDPADCADPIDVDEVGGAITRTFATHLRTPSLREAFCEGVAYAGDDVGQGTPQEARAQTVKAHPQVEFEPTFGAKPVLLGVVDDGADNCTDAGGTLVRGHPDLLAEAADTPGRGLPLRGNNTHIVCDEVPGGAPPCPENEGLKCISGFCVAYPIVQARTGPSFTGFNFWDTLSGELRLLGEDGTQHRIRTFITPNEDVPAAPDNRCLEPDDQELRVTFNRASPHPVDAAGMIDIPAGQFYEVRMVNRNGTFFEQDDDIPHDIDEAFDAGRTIHVCWNVPDAAVPPNTVGADDCEPPDRVEAACPEDGPLCDEVAGGGWPTPPRSLAQCRAEGVECGETPSELVSDFDAGDPLMIYVEGSRPAPTVTGTLEAVRCLEETGWDWTGSDELFMVLSSAGGTTAPAGPDEVTAAATAVSYDMDSGSEETGIGDQLASFSGPQGCPSAYLLQIAEEDDVTLATVLGALTIGIAAVVVAVLCPPCAAAVGIGAAALIAAWVALMELGVRPEDKLGSSAWSASSFDVTGRSAVTHDPGFIAAINANPDDPTLQALPLVDGPWNDFDRPAVLGHPAVGADQLNSNPEATECAADGDCEDTEVCFLGLCVDEGFSDQTVGEGFLGFNEHRQYKDGDSWNYEVFLRWTVSPVD
ncbi:MAG: VCBS repeat-containing protein [Deltaproteobacteria bacterium]|nr:VCBS repeat-containing protein [Deltaproteobacteria bacterium]